ncbi:MULTISPECIES: prepilin-type N-terminal cleavage/methylation domain-containing protein [unclassified Massilia]|uniref:prepilin-type N-terminal cleavage/methylation domain-containing protein n=1 Tax=unclassified Massilia TaxID=2609279 RepID=UPI0018D974CE|nr:MULTISPECIES: prepilin-type N-terminal cleavage/methylation domain-containing protein [unclassified Massilia]
MTSTFRRRAVQGFTLIELLIVVIIIAILAAIAIPQFSNTSGDAQESASIANLTTMRSAIELYRAQHNGNYPSKAPVGTAPATACPTAGATTDNDATTFTDQLTKYSSASGHSCSTQVAGYIYGPYLRAIPVEPLTNKNDVTVVTAEATNPPGAATTGWRFLNTTGALQINSTKLARDGVTLLSAK